MANPSKDQSSQTANEGRDSVDQTAANKPARSTSNRGFASMDRERQREIASLGGRAAHERGTAHEFDSAEARAAGRKGGEAVSQNREHMAQIGRKGGENSRGGARKNSASQLRNANTDVAAIDVDQPSPDDNDTNNLHLNSVQPRTRPMGQNSTR
jgi:general stress protein YciG